MSKNISQFLAAQCLVLILLASPTMSAGTVDDIKVGPRWGKIWLSPRLTANWVNLKYTGASAKEAPVGDVSIVLPAGIRCLWVYGNLNFRQTPLKEGQMQLILPSVALDGSQAMYLYLATDLKAGAAATGRSWAESQGKKSALSEFAVEVLDVPVAGQPKQIMTGIAMWPYMIDNWPDFYPQFASLGFNHMDLWDGSIHVLYATDSKQLYAEDSKRPAKAQSALDHFARVAASARKHGITAAIDMSISWDDEVIKSDPDAQALFVNGTRRGPCPSYRGPGFAEQIRRNAAVALSGITCIQSDEEVYGNGGFTTACVCPRCEDLWKKWLKVNRPGLAYISPTEVVNRKEELPHQWRAWLWFRASLTTERYRLYKSEFESAAEKAGLASAPRPTLAWWAGAADDYSLKICMQDARALADVIDQAIPQLYFRYGIPPRRFRDVIRRQCWALDRKNCYAGIDSDDPAANVPGNLTAAVLETLFAGGKGYCVWYGPFTDTRQWAELAAVNDVAARHESTFLHGVDTDLFRCFAPEGKGDYFHPWSNDVFASTLETDTEGLLLISDYRKEQKPLWVERSRKYTGPVTLCDAFSGQEVAKLSAGQWEFEIDLKKSAVRLLMWKKTTTK